MEIYSGNELQDALQTKTYQNSYPDTVECVKCKSVAYPLLLVDDEDGELSNNSPARPAGHPIWPHDSASFALYMCGQCGEITTEWNQA